jgi:hypothetical protein
MGVYLAMKMDDDRRLIGLHEITVEDFQGTLSSDGVDDKTI